MASVAEHKVWDQSIADAAKSHGWKRTGGGSYQVRGGYIFELRASIPLPDHPSRGSVSAKPLSLDPVFWTIVGLDELNAQSVGFRISGAFTVPLLAIASLAYGVEDSPADVVAALDKEFVALAPTLETLDDFEPIIDQHSPPITGQQLVTHVTWLIAMRRNDAAVELTDEFIAGGSRGGFSFDEGSFELLARQYLQK